MSRPLSPHLQVYRPQISSVLSFFHRSTGVIAAVGLLCIVLWLLLLMGSGPAFALYASVLTSTIGTVFLMLWSFCLFYHLCNGIRHLVWDIGKGFGKQTYLRSGQAVLIITALLTFGLWLGM